MINFKKFNSVISLTSYFTSDEKCKQAIIESRWGVGQVDAQVKIKFSQGLWGEIVWWQRKKNKLFLCILLAYS